jgi:hypothetical protein
MPVSVGGTQRAREGLERRLDHVVGVALRLDVDVHGQLRVVGERPKELLEQLVVEASGRAGRQLGDQAQVGAAGDVDRAEGAGLVHRHDRLAVTGDAAAVPERAVQRLAEHDAGVLDGVVPSRLEVSGDRDVEVEAAVAREQVEHVVEEADAGLACARAGAVEGEAQRHVGLARGARDLGGAAHEGGFSSKSGTRACIEAAWAP